MSSTNKTTNYELSQYVGSDKPTYLGDYNGDMLKIDTQMKTNADNIATATSTANTASTNASEALTTANTANTTAGTANTTANTASSTASAALVKSQQALTEIANLNLTVIDTITSFTTTVGSINTSASSVKVAQNSDGSLAKIYGTIGVQTAGNTSEFTVSFQTSLRPSENITFDNSVFNRRLGSSYSDSSITLRSFTLNTSGVVSYTYYGSADTLEVRIQLLPFLYFIKDFGDTGSND